MRPVLRALLVCFLFTATITGCKLDPPVYPDTPATTVPEVDDGTDAPTDATYTIPIGAINTIAFQVDGGDINTLASATAIVTQPDATTPNGYTGISVDLTNPDATFRLNFRDITAGIKVNDLLAILYKDFNLTDDSGGTIKVTTFKKIGESYHIRGYFKVVAKDERDNTMHTVIGSFNIQQ
ncbi:hypothetical protein FFF34_010025 [Inquilinus sp. KBS0705]|nr:hypothetical protein FFF34_010025 [Inquilinus sp. KBS0705]